MNELEGKRSLNGKDRAFSRQHANASSAPVTISGERKHSKLVGRPSKRGEKSIEEEETFREEKGGRNQ